MENRDLHPPVDLGDGPTPEGEDPFGLLNHDLDGKYLVESVVAEGGFGVVFRGTHLGLKTSVAVKVLKVPAELNGDARRHFLQRFENEAQTMARIIHPAVARVIDFGASPMPIGDAAPWMVLEWLDGRTLEDELSRRRREGDATFSPREALALLRPVIDAVALAHDEGVAHRDIKPGNLMLVTSKRGDVSLKLFDFGIAKATTEGEAGAPTQAHFRAFSPDYAAPEQMSGSPTGPSTDVHALGLIVTELLTGRAPYDGADGVEVCADALSPKRPTPAKRGVDAGDWEHVIARAVSLKPADRFPDAGAFLKALEAVVPTSLGSLDERDEPMALPVQRGPARTLAVAGALLLLAGAALLYFTRPTSTAPPAAQPAPAPTAVAESDVAVAALEDVTEASSDVAVVVALPGETDAGAVAASDDVPEPEQPVGTVFDTLRRAARERAERAAERRAPREPRGEIPIE